MARPISLSVNTDASPLIRITSAAECIVDSRSNARLAGPKLPRGDREARQGHPHIHVRGSGKLESKKVRRQENPKV